MKKHFFSIMAMLVLVVALSGCGSTETPSNTRAFIGGSIGVLSSFVEGEPPTEVTSKDHPFSATIQLENEGEWAVPQSSIWITLKGFDAQEFGTTQTALTKSPDSNIDKNTINPDTGEIIESSPVYATFNLKYSGALTGNHEFPFVADVCYEYGTLSNAELCIKEDILDSKDTKVCTVSGPKNLQNSGGPVQISRFEESTSGKDAVRFFFTLDKVGTGEVTKPDTRCSTLTSNENVVHVKVTSGISGLSCSGLGGGTEGDVKLIEGKKQVQCVQQLSASEKVDKIKLVNIETTYDYLDTIQRTILVKQIS